jgi:hypothetical protein
MEVPKYFLEISYARTQDAKLNISIAISVSRNSCSVRHKFKFLVVSPHPKEASDP